MDDRQGDENMQDLLQDLITGGFLFHRFPASGYSIPRLQTHQFSLQSHIAEFRSHGLTG